MDIKRNIFIQFATGNTQMKKKENKKMKNDIKKILVSLHTSET
jgi:hypothetical protein